MIELFVMALLLTTGYIAGYSVGKDAGESSTINALLDKARQRAEED